MTCLGTITRRCVHKLQKAWSGISKQTVHHRVRYRNSLAAPSATCFGSKGESFLLLGVSLLLIIISFCFLFLQGGRHENYCNAAVHGSSKRKRKWDPLKALLLDNCDTSKV